MEKTWKSLLSGLKIQPKTISLGVGRLLKDGVRGNLHENNAPDGSAVTTSVMQLEYDGQGLLLRITEAGNVLRLVRDRADPLARPILEMGATTNAVRWFVWANGKLLAQVHSNGTIRVAHSDETGKILALTDNSTGSLTDEFAYQPYGRLIAHSGTNGIPFAFMGDYGIWNAGNGLYLTRHRSYDAKLMRFLQPDPIGLEGGRNLYAYASANPLWFIDPLGLCAEASSVMVSVLGARAAAVVGLLFDFGYIADNVGHEGIYITGGIGTGVEVGAENALLDLIEQGINVFNPELREGTIMDQMRFNDPEAHGGFFIGVQQNIDTGDTGLEVGTLGGGVYRSGTIVITIP